MESHVDGVRRWYSDYVGTPETLRGIADGTVPLPDSVEALRFDNLEEIPGHFEGREGMRRWARESFEVMDDGFLELQELVEVSPDAVVTVALVRGRLKNTGIDPRFPLSTAYCFHDGVAVYGRGFSSREDAIEFARNWSPEEP